MDTTLNCCLCLISRVIKSMPLSWFPILAIPTNTRRNSALGLVLEAQAITSNEDLPISKNWLQKLSNELEKTVEQHELYEFRNH